MRALDSHPICIKLKIFIIQKKRNGLIAKANKFILAPIDANLYARKFLARGFVNFLVF